MDLSPLSFVVFNNITCICVYVYIHICDLTYLVLIHCEGNFCEAKKFRYNNSESTFCEQKPYLFLTSLEQIQS